MFFNNQYFPLIAVTVVNFIVMYMLYKDLNAVKSSISNLSSQSTFHSPHFELSPPDVTQEQTPDAVIDPELKSPAKKESAEKKTKERTKEQ